MRGRNLHFFFADPSSIIISEKLAAKYFHEKNPLGEVLRVENHGDFTVGAVIANGTKYSHLQYDALISIHATHPRADMLSTWGSSFGYYTYILTDRPESKMYLEETYFPQMADKYLGTEANYSQWKAAGNQYRYFLQPLAEIHLHSDLKWEMGENGSYLYVNLFMWVGIMILVIACINFTNLSSARFGTRVKEVGVRKIMGSKKRQIIHQFLLESVVLSALSMTCALGLISLSIPYINETFGSGIDLFTFSPVWTIAALIGFTLIVGLLAGIYPALVVSGFNPVSVLNNSSAASSAQSRFRDYLVTAQFLMSFFMIAATFIVYKQIGYVQSKDLGFDKDRLLIIDKVAAVSDKQSFKNQLLNHPGISSVALSADVPGRMDGAATFQKKHGASVEVNMNMLHGDVDLFQTWKLTITEGRPFLFTDYNDTTRRVILNETAAKHLGLEEPFEGAELLDQRRNTLTVVGVVKDFHMESLHREIRPLIIFPRQQWLNVASVRIGNRESLQAVTAHVDGVWKKQVPHRPLAYFFMDDFYESLYGKEVIIGRLSMLFTGLAIVLACLGLYGLSSFSAEQRAKEIGIRKVLGASGWNIVQLFLAKTNRLLIIAIALAMPVTHFVLSAWLEEFAYRTAIGASVYSLSALLLLSIALGTVLTHSLKAARINPAESLKTQ